MTKSIRCVQIYFGKIITLLQQLSIYPIKNLIKKVSIKPTNGKLPNLFNFNIIEINCNFFSLLNTYVFIG